MFVGPGSSFVLSCPRDRPDHREQRRPVIVAARPGVGRDRRQPPGSKARRRTRSGRRWRIECGDEDDGAGSRERAIDRRGQAFRCAAPRHEHAGHGAIRQSSVLLARQPQRDLPRSAVPLNAKHGLCGSRHDGQQDWQQREPDATAKIARGGMRGGHPGPFPGRLSGIGCLAPERALPVVCLP